MFEKRHKKRQEDFTRKRKISFKNIILFELGTLKKTLALETKEFAKRANTEEFSKQAYSEAREKIEPEAFKELNDDIIEGTYEEEHKRYEGYVILAIDGSTVQLPNTKKLREMYGGQSNQSERETVLAKIGIIYDVINEIVLDGKIGRYDTGERETAEELIKIATRIPKVIILMDRGYPSVRLIKLMNDIGVKYVIRLSGKFLKETNEFMNSGKEDSEIEIDIKAVRSIKGIATEFKLGIRCIRVDIESGYEYLITNLSKEEMQHNKFKELYGKRWEIETNYNIIKNVLELGNFTGETKIAIEQDFYATIYLNNVANIAIKEAQEEYNKKGKKETKYKYKINRSIAIGHLKRKLIEIYLCNSPRKRKRMLKDIFDYIQRNVLPERENRQCTRINRRPKFSRSHKRVL